MVKVKKEVYETIVNYLQDISYGSVLITIHNNEIIQLDVLKKQRFDKVQVKQAPPKLVR